MKDKKAIIVYTDWIRKFEVLEDAEAGRLIKHFFRYVNDMNPTTPDRITELSFIDIENSLKRDLEKWEDTLKGRSNSGQLGNLKRWHSDIYKKVIAGKLTQEEGVKLSQKIAKDRTAIKKIANVADSDSDSDSVTVNDTIIKELLNSFSTIEKAARLHKIDIHTANTMMRDFVQEQDAKEDIDRRTLRELRKHFVSWCNIKKEDYKTAKSMKPKEFKDIPKVDAEAEYQKFLELAEKKGLKLHKSLKS